MRNSKQCKQITVLSKLVAPQNNGPFIARFYCGDHTDNKVPQLAVRHLFFFNIYFLPICSKTLAEYSCVCVCVFLFLLSLLKWNIHII